MDIEKIQQNLNSALQERDRIFPLRGKENSPLKCFIKDAWNNWVKRMENPTGKEPFGVFGHEAISFQLEVLMRM